MHFEIVNIVLSKKNIYEKLESYLLNEYNKADTGIIREIINKGSVEDAIKNSQNICNKYEAEGKTIELNIKNMNSYTNKDLSKIPN